MMANPRMRFDFAGAVGTVASGSGVAVFFLQTTFINLGRHLSETKKPAAQFLSAAP